jgi:hypothetical protein
MRIKYHSLRSKTYLVHFVLCASAKVCKHFRTSYLARVCLCLTGIYTLSLYINFIDTTRFSLVLLRELGAGIAQSV